MKSVCTIAAAWAGSASARAWSPRIPKATTAVSIGPRSATIDSTSGACEASVVGVELPHVDRRGARRRHGRDLVGQPVGVARRQHHRRTAASRVASSMPISLRPPKNDYQAVVRRVLHGCDYVLR